MSMTNSSKRYDCAKSGLRYPDLEASEDITILDPHLYESDSVKLSTFDES